MIRFSHDSLEGREKVRVVQPSSISHYTAEERSFGGERQRACQGLARKCLADSSYVADELATARFSVDRGSRQAILRRRIAPCYFALPRKQENGSLHRGGAPCHWLCAALSLAAARVSPSGGFRRALELNQLIGISGLRDQIVSFGYLGGNPAHFARCEAVFTQDVVAFEVEPHSASGPIRPIRARSVPVTFICLRASPCRSVEMPTGP